MAPCGRDVTGQELQGDLRDRVLPRDRPADRRPRGSRRRDVHRHLAGMAGGPREPQVPSRDWACPAAVAAGPGAHDRGSRVMAQAMKPRRASAPTFAMAAMLPAMLAVAAACWVFTVREMSGMDMGVATQLGSLQFFVAAWVSMMAAMMLPGALPALIRRARAGRSVLALLQFAVSYLTVWTVVGLVAYALYHPHGTAIAGTLTVAAGLYELT